MQVRHDPHPCATSPMTNLGMGYLQNGLKMKLVRTAGVEPARSKARDFKSQLPD
jgi:hypothetical protein